LHINEKEVFMLSTSGPSRQSYTALETVSEPEYEVQGFVERPTDGASTVDQLNFSSKKVANVMSTGYSSISVPFIAGMLAGSLANTDYYGVSIACAGVAISSLALIRYCYDRPVFWTALVASTIATGAGLLSSFHEELGIVPGEKVDTPYFPPSPPTGP
jgi:hypothetical protein